jgi:hypothetical protein
MENDFFEFPFTIGGTTEKVYKFPTHFSEHQGAQALASHEIL